jgi:hypothetical protein
VHIQVGSVTCRLDKDKLACPEPRVLDEDKLAALNQEWYSAVADRDARYVSMEKFVNKRLGPDAKGPKYYFRSAYGTQNAVSERWTR